MVIIYIAEDHRHRPVVIHSRNRIELVIVTAGTVDRKPHEALKSGADHIVQVFIPVVRIIFLPVTNPRPDSIIGSGDQTIVVSIIEFITGKLLDNETVIGLVLVKGLDDIIPVAPGIGDIKIVLIAGAIGITYDIQPEPAPPLAIM